jgi:hypothetical protein
MVCRASRQQEECPFDNFADHHDAFKELNVSYPKTTAKRRRELKSIRKKL